MKKKLRIALALVLALSLLSALPALAAGTEENDAADALNALGLFQGWTGPMSAERATKTGRQSLKACFLKGSALAALHDAAPLFVDFGQRYPYNL